MLLRRKIISFSFLVAVALLFLPGILFAAGSNSWTLASPDKQCAISVSLAGDGTLSYEASRLGKTVIEPSPLGLLRDDQDFEHSLTFDHADKVEKHREKYELFASTQPRVVSSANGKAMR